MKDTTRRVFRAWADLRSPVTVSRGTAPGGPSRPTIVAEVATHIAEHDPGALAAVLDRAAPPGSPHGHEEKRSRA